MEFSHILVVISVFISLAGSVAYIKNTLTGKTKPNRISWGLWAFAPLVGTGAALSAGADVWALTRVFLSGFLPLIIFLASFVNKQSYWKLTTFDFLCGVCSVVGLFLWLGVDSPRMAILFAAIGDGFACLPTLAKAWKHPETETGLTFFASLIATLLVLPSIEVWNIENSAFQVYLLIANVLLLFSIYRRRLGFSRKLAPTL